MGREIWVVVHRWAGLTIAGFLVVAAATGSLLTFREELTFATGFNKAHVAPPRPGASPLDGLDVARRVEQATGRRVIYAPLSLSPDHPVLLQVAPSSTAVGRAAFNSVWADPYTGRVQLTYRDGALSDGPQNIMPFLYRLHYSLALGAWGELAFGVAALIWTVDCFVGFYLTLPRRRRTAAGPRVRSWWSAWKPAWRVRTKARGFKLDFDLHRAGGLWLWPLLLVFAWSSVGFTLPGVYDPIMSALGASPSFRPVALGTPLAEPPIDLREARARGRALMASEAQREGFRVTREGYLYYAAASGDYLYTVRSTLDFTPEDAATALWFSGRDGRVQHLDLPAGRTAADGVTGWFSAIHRARVVGLPYRILEAALGLGIVGLTVTGVLVWMRKRSARLLRKGARVRYSRSSSQKLGDAAPAGP